MDYDKNNWLAKSLLVVIDMQNGFLNDRSKHIIPNVLRLVREYEQCSFPVVFTRFINRYNSQYERLIGWTKLRVSPEIDLAHEIEPHAQRVIDKFSYSVFTAEFNELVHTYDIETVVLCGVATDSCVLKTALDSFERGLRPIIVADACSSHAGEQVHNAALMVIGRNVGRQQIVNTNEFLSMLEGPSEHELGELDSDEVNQVR